MAFPTRHWRKGTGTLTAGQRVSFAHGLCYGVMSAVAPDAVHFDMDTGTYTEAPNQSIGCYQASTSSYVYLSNWSPTTTHYYGVVARLYHSIDDTNL